MNGEKQSAQAVRMRSLRSVFLGMAVACYSITHAGFAKEPVTSHPSKPGIFGIGFTNVTDSSARLVFTTSEPMGATVDVFDGQIKILHRSEVSFEEIHAFDLDSLSRQKEYRVMISARGKEGDTALAETTLMPLLRPPSLHRWPGYTIFSSTISGDGDNPAVLDLLAQSGARMARVEIGWDGVYPQRGHLNQAYLDRMLKRVAEMKKRGIEPLVVLDYCVAWAKPYTDTTMTWRNVNFGPPDDLVDWKQYVRTVVNSMRGTARYYEIWNEPDAGYLATGSFVERPNLRAPIGRPPFKDNWDYWIGDRYAPMISAAREVMDKLQPGAIVMNGGWNRDYSGQRGDILLKRGAGPFIDLYAYHVYSHTPASFSRWYKEVDGGFRQNIDRIFVKNDVQMPLAVTEWGWPTWDSPQAGKGFVTFDDAELFYIKSTFYFLSAERFEVLSQFCLGVGPVSRNRDPLFFMLVNEDENHKPVITPVFKTYQWLATTFGSKVYRSLPVKISGAPEVKAYAIQLKDSQDIYLAAWQDGPVDDDGVVSPLPARKVGVSIGGIQPGKYSLSILNVDGHAQSVNRLKGSSYLVIQAPLPAASITAESRVFLAKITLAGK